MSYIEKKFFREGQNETPSQIDLYKNRSNGELVYRDPNGIEIIVSPQGGLESIINDVNSLKPKYKVYTALLTQSGGSDAQAISSGELTIGVTYTIQQDCLTADFTNVGAPNNNAGTSFVATATTPNSWGDCGGIMLEYTTGAPVVTVLENTIGNVYFTYGEQGVYRIKLPQFDITKTYYSNGFGNKNHMSVTNDRIIMSANPDFETFDINTFEGGPPADFILYDTPIEIRVYN